MDNFLTTLYFELFKNTNKEKMLRNNRFTVDSDIIRNDQSISETMFNRDILKRLITEYLKLRDGEE